MASVSVVSEISVAAQPHPTFLKRLGHMGLECVTTVLPFLTRQAQRAEPIVDLLFPLEGPIYTSVVNSICLAEAAGAQAASQEQTGPMKLQAVWNSAGPMLLQLAEDHGALTPESEAHAKQYIEALVMILNGPVKVVDPGKASSS